jgi:peptidoglycan/LPS O-acetylase OafA/YrhL
VLNLAFVNGWSFEHSFGFNGPIWSVSIEIAIYAVFFLMARYVLSLGLLLPVFIAGACCLSIQNESVGWGFPLFGLCGFFFYVGVGVYYWLLKFRRDVWMILIPSSISALIFGYLIVSGEAAQMRFYNVEFFLFVPLVLLIGWLDLSEPFRRLIRPVKWIGDATYSMYLWHMPMQVLILIIFTYFALDQASCFDRPIALIAWVIGMVVLAHHSFVWIERPLQNFVRAKIRNITLEEPRP